MRSTREYADRLRMKALVVAVLDLNGASLSLTVLTCDGRRLTDDFGQFVTPSVHLRVGLQTQSCPRVHFVWPDPTQPIS